MHLLVDRGDGATLLYTAWRAFVVQPADGDDRPVDGRSHMIASPVDTSDDVTVLTLGGAGSYSDH